MGRLEVYPHPEDGLWISESALASAMKKGEVDMCLYGVSESDLKEPINGKRYKEKHLEGVREIVAKHKRTRDKRWLSRRN